MSKSIIKEKKFFYQLSTVILLGLVMIITSFYWKLGHFGGMFVEWGYDASFERSISLQRDVMTHEAYAVGDSLGAALLYYGLRLFISFFIGIISMLCMGCILDWIDKKYILYRAGKTWREALK